MATNLKQFRDVHVARPMTVPSGTGAGQVVNIGTTGLTAFTLTKRMSADDVANAVAQGLNEGEASVIIIGVSYVADLLVDAAVTVGQKLYVNTATPGTLTTTATNNNFAGYALQALAAAGVCAVGLTNA